MSVRSGVLAAIGLMLITIPIVQGGEVRDFLHPGALLLVLGGLLAAACLGFPSEQVRDLGVVIRRLFDKIPDARSEYARWLLGLCRTYRQGGLKPLEAMEPRIPDPFLRRGVALIVDGYSREEIRDLLEQEILLTAHRRDAALRVLRTMAKLAPAFGLAGTVVSLIQMLRHLQEPAAMGPSMALALLTTFYGLLLANLLFVPLASKIREQGEREGMSRRMLLLGVLAIFDKTHPIQLHRKLEGFLEPPHRGEGAAQVEGAMGNAAALSKPA